ncbi:MAG TPA: BTAD domain-containing putative transcriptional regulator [Fimbriimonas sp.]|nr:BTAD domain-containing putative transcriptional regulator [Fimbriimonas sp.]
MPHGKLTIKLFGPLDVRVEGEPMPRGRTRSVGWLLALLTLKAGRAVSRSLLAGLLWPESDESQALQNLRHDLVSLRKSLGSAGECIKSPTRDSLTLEVSSEEVDVLAFDEAIRAGHIDALRTAIELYSGPFLEGCDREWASAERTARSEQCLAAFETLIKGALDERDPSEATRLCRRALGLDPLREESTRLLMTALAEQNDLPGVLEAYQGLRNRLHAELHAVPHEATTNLLQEIRTKFRNQPQTRKRVDALPRLKRPPLPLNHLLGRLEEIETVLRHLEKNRLVTLTGAGGVGKTRLAIEVSARVAEPEGVAWVELALENDPSRLVRALATALGLDHGEEADDLTIQSIVAKAEQGPLLLVLDNCEHMIEEVTRVVETLITASANLKVLCTSRQRLGISGEIAWRLPPLKAPEGSDLTAEQAAQYPAVKLFVERAVAVNPGFLLDAPGNLAAVCTICRRLDGIPLALELAAARVAMLTPASIAQRLDQRFALLTGGARTALPRQKTLRSLIEWSYDLLDEDERVAFCDLGVLAGTWTLEAAEAICSVDALDIVGSLIDKSLVVAEQDENGVRYRMLETIREYAAERLLESGRMEAARHRHLAYFARLAEGLELEIAQGAATLVEKELSNLSAALIWAQQRPEESSEYARLVASIWPFWSKHGSVFDGCIHVESALDAVSDEALRAKLITAAHELINDLHGLQYQIAARAMPSLGDVPNWREATPAKVALENATQLLRRLGQKPDLVLTLRCLASVAETEGDHLWLFELFQEAVALCRELGSRFFLAMTLHECGCAYYRMGRNEEARAMLTEALALFKMPGGEQSVCFASNNLAMAAFALGDREAACDLRLQGLMFALPSGNWDDISWSIAGFAKAGGSGAAAQQCALLLGAASIVARDRLVNVGLRVDAERDLRATLGDACFQASFVLGASLGPAACIAYALQNRQEGGAPLS